MKNIFDIKKIFSLISLISLAAPSLVAEIGNSSLTVVPSEKSELSYTTVGLAVTGISVDESNGVVYQRPCTFAFPIKSNEGSGYLTPASCVIGSVLVADDEIGTVIFANFDANLGID